MIDRTRFAAQGFERGQPGALGEFLADGEPKAPKTVVHFKPDSRVALGLPGGGGYGDPRARDPERVLGDVVSGYVTIAAAAREYGVAIEFLGAPGQLVRLPEHYRIDWDATNLLRANSTRTE